MVTWNPAANELFLKALDIADETARRAFLDEACGPDSELRAEVESLLAADRDASGFLLDPVEPGASTEDFAYTPGPRNGDEPGQTIGSYRLIKKLGSGGMGTVWLAEQSGPVKREVALKLIKPGMDTERVVARFETERQALAMMNHDNIARVFDGGATTTGRPYFVMEFVAGPAITTYCDEKNLTVRERLELFVDVCHAVQHAHQKAIIHRDLKPSNVLVAAQEGRPVPKVIDFGIAKALTEKFGENTFSTHDGQIIGTPEYMSPEQAASQDIDTRADVYGLGALLYQLFCGSPPTRKGLRDLPLTKMIRIIREEEPPRPSTRLLESRDALPELAARRGTDARRLAKLLRGDLDWIAMKALEKDRNRRYETVASLARDIERYLTDQPVRARPPSLGDRLGKFARRNRVGLAAAVATAIVFLTLAGSVGWSVRDSAARAAADAQRIESALDEAEGKLRHQDWMNADLAARRAEALLGGRKSETEHSQRLRQVRADLRIVARIEEIRMEQANLSGDFPDHAGADTAYAEAFEEYGIDVEVLSPAEAAVRIGDSRVHGPLIAALDDWAWVRTGTQQKGHERLVEIARLVDPDEWRSQFREHLAGSDRKALAALAVSPEARTLTPAAAVLLARRLRELGDRQRVPGDHQMAYDILIAAQARHPGDYWLNAELCTLLMWRLNRPVEAVSFGRAALALRPDNPHAMVALGNALRKSGAVEQAQSLYQAAIDRKPEYADAHNALGCLHVLMLQWDEAISCFQISLQLNPNAVNVQHNLAMSYIYSGQWSKAVQPLTEYAHRSNDHWTRVWQAGILLLAGDHEGYRKLCQDYVGRLGPNSSEFDMHRVVHMCTLSPESGVEPERIIQMARRCVSLNPMQSRKHLLALAYYRAGRINEAAPLILGFKPLTTDPGRAGEIWSRMIVAMIAFRQGNIEEARRWLDEACTEIDGPRGERRRSWVTPGPEVLRVSYHILRREAEELIRPRKVAAHDKTKSGKASLHHGLTRKESVQHTDLLEAIPVAYFNTLTDVEMAKVWDLWRKLTPDGRVRLADEIRRRLQISSEEMRSYLRERIGGMKYTREEAQRLVREFRAWGDAVRTNRAANAALIAPEVLTDHAATPISLLPREVHPTPHSWGGLRRAMGLPE